MNANKPETISEAQADLATRAVFEDIKSTMGVALVNLVWRRLAVVPSVLHGSWQTLKPHYQSGKIPQAAWWLREQMVLPAVAQINATERDGLKHELNDASVVDDVLRTYERGNAQNLIALCHLRLFLDLNNSPQKNPAVVYNADQSSINLQGIHQRPNIDQSRQEADARFGQIPDLPNLENLPEDMQRLIAKASDIWIPAKYKGLTPSVFRHLAHWPELLMLFVNRLEAIEHATAPNIQTVASQALQAAEVQASLLGKAGTDLAELSSSDRQWLQQVLDVFIDGMLVRGVVIVPTLRSMLGVELK